MDYSGAGSGPTNPGVRDAITQLCEDPSISNRRELYDRLLPADLVLAVKESPLPGIVGVFQLQDDARIDVLTTMGPEGKPAALVFADASAATERNASAKLLVVDSRTVLKLAVRGNQGLLLNAAGPWAYIPHEDVIAMLKELGVK